jgi:3-oxoacyl-[acyl-carrier protein] reductase
MSDSDYRLDGQWALVTGSTHGIGRGIALELAAAGANLVILGRDAAAAEEVRGDVQGLKRDAVAVVTDLRDESARQRLLEEVWNTHPLDLVVNNAGADVLTGDAAVQSFGEKLASLWTVDVASTIDLTRGFGERMRSRGHGAIVNIGWDQAEIGMAGDSGEFFAATKGAIMSFTRSAAKSFAPQVRVNCVAPGWIRTAWGQQASDYWQERVISESLMLRWGEVGDVAHAVRFLASPAASYITGHILPVNGGRP